MKPIDGDISDFLDAGTLAAVYSVDELLKFLRREGHAEVHILKAVRRWQAGQFAKGPEGTWEQFTLTEEGAATVRELRSMA